MPRDDLNVLASFAAVAEERSFTRAARRLGVSPSALSHAIRGLEERLGVRLLARTTRSVSPSEAGEHLLARLTPAMADISEALEQVAALGARPMGRVRLLTSPTAAAHVLAPKLTAFLAAFPEVVLDVTTTVDRLDLVAAGYDAGIHLGEFIAEDMVAVRVSPEQRMAAVASPGYLARHPAPRTPHGLTEHRCLNLRQGEAGLYRWEFEKEGQALTVAVAGPLVSTDPDLLIRAALDGAGLAFTIEARVLEYLASGSLVRVLEDWCPPFAGYFLYYPSRRQQPAALSALIDALRMR